MVILLGAAVAIAGGCKKDKDKPRAEMPAPPAGPSTAQPITPGDAIPEAELALAIKERRLDHWYGLYMGGKKMGYAHVEARPTVEGEPGGYMAGLEAVLMADGEEARAIETTYYEAVPPYRLVETHVTESMSGSTTERRYVAKGDELIVHSTLDGKTQPQRTLPGTAETLAAVIAPMPDPDRVDKGQRTTYVDFAVDDEKDKQNTTTVIDIRTERIAGVETRVAVIEERIAGEQIVSEARIAGGGIALAMSIGGISLKLEDQATAKSDIKGYDMVADAVAVSRDLGDASDLRELTLIVSVGARFRPPDAPYQRVTERADGRLDVVIRSVPGAAATADERAEALAATHDVNWKDPSIVRAAAEIVAAASSDREKVNRLLDWVYKTLRKNLTSNAATASQVLARKAGDCTEHALLFAALARAQGVPARRASGLVYMGDEVHRFGWHEWNEVILDGHWVQVDASWNEEIANATHLLLGSGSSDDSIMAMGNMKLEVARAK